jgi:hypothetical protein
MAETDRELLHVRLQLVGYTEEMLEQVSSNTIKRSVNNLMVEGVATVDVKDNMVMSP